MGTFGGILSTGQQALQAHQTALQVTGQNIANANTSGYSRERAELVSALSSHTNILRSGVNVEEITRAYDRFITTQVTVASSNLKSTQTQSDLLGQVEALFNDLEHVGGRLPGALDVLPGFARSGPKPSGPLRAQQRLAARRERGRSVPSAGQWAPGVISRAQCKLGDAVVDVNQLTTQLATLNRRSGSVRWIPRITPTPCMISSTSS